MTPRDPMILTMTGLGALLSAAACVLLGTSAGFGAFVGACLAVGNFVAFRYLVRSAFRDQRAGGLLAFKLVTTLCLVFVVQRVLGVDPRGLAIGYAALPLGAVLAVALHRSTLLSTES